MAHSIVDLWDRVPAADKLSQRLHAQFDSARFGHYFRTRTLINSTTLAKEWLFAVQDPFSRSCVLMKVRQDDSGLHEHTRVKENLSFTEALDQMSRFENTTANPQYFAADENEIETLGKSHFNAFANREGLVRDQITGAFHPTLKGQVVSKGSFDPAELDRTLRHAQKPPSVTEKFLVPAHAATAKFDGGTIERIIALHRSEEELKILAASHEALCNIAEYNFKTQTRGGFSAAECCAAINLVKPGYINSISADYTALTSPPKAGKGIKAKASALMASRPDPSPYQGRVSAYTFTRILADLRAMKFEDENFKKQHDAILDRHQLSFEFSLARHFSNIVLQQDSMPLASREEAAKHLAVRLDNLDKVATRMGIDQVMRTALRACIPGKTLPACFAETRAFVRTLDSAAVEVKKTIEDQARHISDLAP